MTGNNEAGANAETTSKMGQEAKMMPAKATTTIEMV